MVRHLRQYSYALLRAPPTGLSTHTTCDGSTTCATTLPSLWHPLGTYLCGFLAPALPSLPTFFAVRDLTAGAERPAFPLTELPFPRWFLAAWATVWGYPAGTLWGTCRFAQSLRLTCRCNRGTAFMAWWAPLRRRGRHAEMPRTARRFISLSFISLTKRSLSTQV